MPVGDHLSKLLYGLLNGSILDGGSSPIYAFEIVSPHLSGINETNHRNVSSLIDVRFKCKSILSTMRINGDMCPMVFERAYSKNMLKTSPFFRIYC